MFRKVAVALALLSVPALADQITLKNGDRLTGAIEKSDAKTLVLKTDYAGEIMVQYDQIENIESSGDLHVATPEGKTLVGTVTTSGDKLRVATKDKGTLETPVATVAALRGDAEQTAYEKTLHPPLWQGWDAGLNFGFALTRGNSQSKNLNLAFIGTRQTLRDKLGLYANSVYSANDAPGANPSTTANTAGGGARYDHDLTDKVFAFAAGDFFSDGLQELNLRSVLGGGLGFHVIKSTTTTFDLLGGANYTHESYSTFSRNLAALTLGEELGHKFRSTELFEKGYFFPDLSDTGQYRATFDAGTVTKLNKWLGWQNAFSDVYVTNPPPGTKSNDIVLTTGLNIAFKH
ncbi:MAG: DUF481 domain-containing protein [Acidobacteriales bacterium]|nr:DUF481 domain-containing protein [Terriglobales bacterium]